MLLTGLLIVVIILLLLPAANGYLRRDKAGPELPPMAEPRYPTLPA